MAKPQATQAAVAPSAEVQAVQIRILQLCQSLPDGVALDHIRRELKAVPQQVTTKNCIVDCQRPSESFVLLYAHRQLSRA